MKYLILISLLAVGAQAFFTAQQVGVAKQLSTACEAEVGEGLPENIGERFREGDLTLADDKSKCYMKCIFSKVGFLNEAGDVNKEKLVEKLSKGNPRDKAEIFGERCNTFEGANACEKAAGLFECYHKNKATIFA